MSCLVMLCSRLSSFFLFRAITLFEQTKEEENLQSARRNYARILWYTNICLVIYMYNHVLLIHYLNSL